MAHPLILGGTRSASGGDLPVAARQSLQGGRDGPREMNRAITIRQRPVWAVSCAILLAVVLLSCSDDSDPTDPYVDGTPIGPAGGTVTSADGRLSLVIPAGALSAEINITVEPAAAPPTDIGMVAGRSYDLGPTGTLFAQPAALSLSFADATLPTGVDEGALRLCRVSGGAWMIVAGSVCDADGDRVSGSITGFSTWGVGAPQAGPSVDIDPSPASIGTGGRRQFAAVVTGLAETTVTWSVLEGRAGGTVDPTGFYAAPGWAGAYHLIARANADAAVADTAIVSVVEQWVCDENAVPVEDPPPFKTSFHLEVCMDYVYDNEKPRGIAWDNHFLWVAGGGKSYVAKFTESGELVGWLGRGVDSNPLGGEYTYTGWHPPYDEDDLPFQGEGDGEFVAATGVAVDADHNLYVGDGYALQRFGGDHAFMGRWTTSEPGVDDPYFIGVAVAAPDRLFVTDPGHARVNRFDHNGAWQLAWGTFGFGPGEFHDWTMVATDARGNCYVTDLANGVAKFDADGNFLGCWGTETDGGPCGLDMARGIAVDAAGFVYVADSGHGRIVKTTGDGVYITEWSVPEAGGSHLLYGLAVDPDGNVYAASSSRDMILIYGP
jgi:hypothetical protein